MKKTISIIIAAGLLFGTSPVYASPFKAKIFFKRYHFDDIPVVKPMEAYLYNGGLVRGEYHPKTDTIYLSELATDYVIAHELGHYYLEHNPFIFMCDGYVTEYARSSVYEDNAETFATYLLRGDYFRSLVVSNTCLRSKYETMKDYFSGIEY